MNLPEFLTYCELKDLFVVRLQNDNNHTLSIQTPYDDIALYLLYQQTDDSQVIIRGQFYKYSDYELDHAKSFEITMPEIEEVFFPE